MNTGHFVLIPTTAALRFAEAWHGSAWEMQAKYITEQQALYHLNRRNLTTCGTVCECFRERYRVSCCCERAVDRWATAVH